MKIEFNEDFVAKIWQHLIILVKAHDLFVKSGSQSSMEVTIVCIFFLDVDFVEDQDESCVQGHFAR